jgi:diguanylate cyclase (GGDEF)-like protein
MDKSIKSPVEISAISGLSFFAGLDETELKIVSESLFFANVNKGDFIFNEGDTGEELFINYSGELSSSGTQSDGKKRHLYDIKPGDFFGEMSIISHEPRSTTITAVSDSVVILMEKNDFYRIISKYPIIGFKILRAIGVIQNKWLEKSAKSYNDLIRWGENARKKAITDEMTGIYNRDFLEDSIKERFTNRSMNLRVISLLMMDLDRIHDVNDRYGIKAGDLVIIAVAKIITSCLRPGDIPARLSGDEFAVLLTDINMENAIKVAARIREKIEKMQIEIPEKEGSNVKISICTSISIGIALSPVHAKTEKELIEVSDTALRKAKVMGRNRIEVYGD